MPLRVAACPRCQSPLVFGERACRGCGQTFQYGAAAPPEPSAQQVREALVAAGLAPPASAPAAQAPLATPARSSGGSDLIDRGRFDAVDVVVARVADLVFTELPGADVDVRTTPVAGLDMGRFSDVGPVAPAFTPGLEVNPRDDVGQVFTQPVSGLFHSDIFRTTAEVVRQPIEGFEPSPSSSSPIESPAAQKAARPAQKGELSKITCRCGEVHRLPRCPACGTAHPDSP